MTEKESRNLIYEEMGLSSKEQRSVEGVEKFLINVYGEQWRH